MPLWVILLQSALWLAVGFLAGTLYGRLRARVEEIERILRKSEEEQLYRAALDMPKPVIPQRTPEWPTDYVKKD